MTIDPNRPYGNLSYDDRKYLDEHMSSSAILNTVSKAAGVLKQGGVHVAGEDKTYEELRAEQKHETAHDTGTKVEIVEHVAEQIIEGFREAAPEAAKMFVEANEAAAPFLTLHHLIKEVHEDWQKGQELNKALIRDAMHVALVESMNGMPTCYVNHAKEERPHASTGDHGPHAKIVEELSKKESAPMRMALQIRTDEGMRAAVDLTTGGTKQAPAEYLKASGLAKRYHDDPAFHAGFDAMTYAAAHDRAQFDQARTAMDARDARFGLSQIFRG